MKPPNKRDTQGGRILNLVCTDRGQHPECHLADLVFDQPDRGLPWTVPETWTVGVGEKGLGMRYPGGQMGESRGPTPQLSNSGLSWLSWRLRCPRCGRDERWSDARLRKMADALMSADPARRVFKVDLSRIC